MKTLTDRIEEERQKMAISDGERDKGIDLNPVGIIQENDLVYGTSQQLYDIYYPENQQLTSIIINVHGGGWFYGDKQLYKPYCLQLAKQGFIVVNFNYRLAPEYPFPAALDDVNELFQWVGKWVGDKKVVVIGDSAGASLALQYVTIQSNSMFRELFPYLPLPYKISKVLLYCGVYFLEKSFTMTKGRLKDLRKAYLPDDVWKKYRNQLQTENYISSEFPNLMLATGSEDFLREDTWNLHDELSNKGIQHVIKEYQSDTEEMRHVFELDQRKKEFSSILADACSFLQG